MSFLKPKKQTRYYFKKPPVEQVALSAHVCKEEPLTVDIVKHMLCEKDTVLGKRGYALLKSDYDANTLDEIRQELTVVPFTLDDYGIPPRSFPVYLESPKKLYLPKHYAYRKFGSPTKVASGIEPARISLEFKGSIRANQQEPIDAFLHSCHLDEAYDVANLAKDGYSYGGIISLPCGWGKTVIGLYLTARLGVKTLIIVHKEFLVNQWKERIEQFLPDAKVGTIQQNRSDVVGKDIVIGMLQSISMKEYPDWVFADFGFTIVDECHHISSEVFSRALPKINARYMFALSATPKRKDKLEKVMEWYIGPYLYIAQQENTRKVRVNMVYYYNSNPYYSGIDTFPNGKPCLARMTNNITEFSRRNALLMEILRRSVDSDDSHVLALSDRREHLRYLHDKITETETATVGYYVGGMKERDLKETESKKIMLSTFTMSSEALDVASLNTLVLMTSHSGGSVHTQSCGRILRKTHGDFVPTIWDVVDDFSSYKNQAKGRLEYYKKQNYDIYKVVIHDSDDIPVSELCSRLDDLEAVGATVRKKYSVASKGDSVPKCETVPPVSSGKCLLTEEDEY